MQIWAVGKLIVLPGYQVGNQSCLVGTVLVNTVEENKTKYTAAVSHKQATPVTKLQNIIEQPLAEALLNIVEKDI